jgi:hypothetical protein
MASWTTLSTQPDRLRDDMTDNITFYDEIESYCAQLSTAPGGSIDLHVSTKAAAFDVVVERWGGERDVVWKSLGNPGVSTLPPSDADSNGCGWPASLSIAADPIWRSGFYLVTVTAAGAAPGRDVSYCGFVVTGNPDDRAGAVLMLSTNTWNAYNTWGGESLYTGGKQVSFERPWSRGMLSRPEVDRDDRKSRPTRWGEEPDVNGDCFQEYRFAHGYPAAIGSTGWFAHERRFAEWAERAGYRFDYCVSSDLEDPKALDGYDLFIDVGHDEYWSAAQRRTLERHVERGANIASMSGNTMFWQVRLEGNAMVCHKYSAHDTDPVMAEGREVEMSGMWCDPIIANPEWSLFGAGSAWGLYSRFGQATPRGSGGYTVYRADHWLVAGTGLRYGDVLGAKHGVVGYETTGRLLDLDDYQLPITRPHATAPSGEQTVVVAFTPSSNVGMGEYPASISALSDQGDLEFIASRLHGRVDADSLARVRHGNSVMMVVEPFGDDGGEVVVIGTTDWAFGLGDDPEVQQVTANLLDRYLS